MTPDAERFIELASRPLDDDAELRLSAQAESRQAIEVANRPEGLAETADLLDRADGHPRRKGWRIVLAGITLLVSLPLIVHTARQISNALGVAKNPVTFQTRKNPGSRSRSAAPALR